MPTFDKSSWAKLEPAFNKHIESADPDVAHEAVDALWNLLCREAEAWGAVPPEPAAAALLGAMRRHYGDCAGLPPEPVAAALLGAMRRHPGAGKVQWNGCAALGHLCRRFPALRASLRRDASVLATVQRAATVDPNLEEENWFTKELCVWLEPQAEEQGRHQSGYSGYSATGASPQLTNSPQHQGEPHLAAAPAVQQPAKEAAASKAKKSGTTIVPRTSVEAVEIPTGEGTPVAMFSARFDGGPIEKKMRRVHQILVDNSYRALMVGVGAGESFGVLTARYLGQLKADKGVMIAVCTHHYGEMTSSEFCSFHELKFAVTYGITVLPLKVEDTYPPQPPCGKGHLDKHCDALGFISMKLGPDVMYEDCTTKSEMEIACAIATRLRQLRDDRQVG